MHLDLIHLKDDIKCRESQGSTTHGSVCSPTHMEDEEDSVSSSSDSNQLDLDDLLEESFPILIVNDNKSQMCKGCKNIPTLDFDLE